MIRDRAGRESSAYMAVIVGLQACYLVGASAGPTRFFGVNQLRDAGLLGTLGFMAAIWVIALYLDSKGVSGGVPATKDAVRSVGWPLSLLLSLVGALIYFLLASNTVNPDGAALLEKIPRDVAAQGAHITHDEMLELYIHSRLYFYAHSMFGWSVIDTYRALSVISGGTFLFFLLRLVVEVKPRGLGFAGLVLCGGYLQLFFGDVENYSLVATLILVYLVAARSHLRGATPLWIPSILLSTAIGFHALAGWLVPSWIYLIVRSLRGRRPREVVLAVAALLLPIAGLAAFFNSHGLPIQRLFDSSHISGMGGHYDRYFSPLRLEYAGAVLNAILLLAPTIIILAPLAYFGRLGAGPDSRFLQIAALSMLVFAFVWKAQLGVYEDWNLFAPGMIPVALLVADSFCGIQKLPRRRLILVLLVLTSATHSLAWVLRNHHSAP